MESNLLLEQYSRYKKMALDKSPYRCLLNTHIELNPHQVNAFVAAVHALENGGIILADEVGLGKTIEAGLVLKYVLDSGAKKVLIALPATLRMQWLIELDEKFGLKSEILDRLTVEKDPHHWKSWLEGTGQSIVLASYDYASKLMRKFPSVKWDFMIIDEAHNLRNVFHGAKRAKNLYELSKGIPKILLTATPLQNSLSDLHGLVSYIDPRIFGSEKSFIRRYVQNQDYQDLKQAIAPVLYRTLRKDVAKYMHFSKRICHTVDFHLTKEEKDLYDLVNAFLKRDTLYSIPGANRGLIILVIRKLLASSSFALIDTFEVLKNRLEKLYQGTRSENAQEGFDLFWAYVEDEIDETGFDEEDDEDTQIRKQNIQDELDAVNQIIEVASGIRINAKIEALKEGVSAALASQEKDGIPQKVTIFTESKRTQKYIAEELLGEGYEESDIVLFNGDSSDDTTRKIYRTWQVKNYGNPDYGRSVELKHAIVDYFRHHAKILIVTDAGSEGLNLQFCNTVINYDLPWNPQKIEQRIGRCHRYGQKYDVVAINLLNTDNEADRRVYEILSKKFELFDGVFGASDEALGAIESGTGFEKQVLEIFQKCNTNNEIDTAFNRLDRSLDLDRDEQVVRLKDILITESPQAKEKSLDQTRAAIKRYLQEVEYWDKFSEPETYDSVCYWRIRNWGEEFFGSHGTMFLGAYCRGNELLFPVMSLCDENGDFIDFDEEDLVRAIEGAQDDDIHTFRPDSEENRKLNEQLEKLSEMLRGKYLDSVRPYMDYNRKKVNGWIEIQKEQLFNQKMTMNGELEELISSEMMATDSLEKADIRKKIAERKKKADRFSRNFDAKIEAVKKEGAKEISDYNGRFEADTQLLINVVLEF